MIPLEFEIEFSSVRSLSPQQFVEKLAQELHVHGVVAGENVISALYCAFSFGRLLKIISANFGRRELPIWFQGCWDSSALVRLCEEYRISARIIPSVMEKNQSFIHMDTGNSKERGQLSSTRHALAAGDMNYVTELLGRRHRLILVWSNESKSCRVGEHSISVPKSWPLNLAPRDGLYRNCFMVPGCDPSIPCEVEMNESCLYAPMDEADIRNTVDSQDLRTLRIEFG